MGREDHVFQFTKRPQPAPSSPSLDPSPSPSLSAVNPLTMAPQEALAIKRSG